MFMIKNVRNTFFEQSYQGKKVLALVPHPDDEVHVAGSMLCALGKAGAELYCAYTTNGDFQFKASTRFKEALSALRVLGIAEDHVFFLGYGDTLNHCGKPHVFYADQPVPSPAGFISTYGTTAHPDYAWKVRGEHSPYCRSAYKHDIQELLLAVRADIIFCVDYDQHADHRMLSLLFEKVMGDILARPNNTYHPIIYKAFAYCTAYEAVTDFYAPNILSTQRPKIGTILDFPTDMMENSIYAWEERVRFPIIEICRGRFLRKNRLFEALFQHHSQGPAMHAGKTINGDAVFWQRRTDNLAYQARLSASSGDTTPLRSFQRLVADDIDTEVPSFVDRLWTPEAADTKKILTFHWQELQRIVEICLYGNLHTDGQIQQLQVRLDGDSVYQGGVPMQGRPLRIQVSTVRMVETCELQILAGTGKRYGLAGCEFFSARQQLGPIVPFIKIMMGGQFIYDHWLPRWQTTCSLQVYAYGIEPKVSWQLQAGSMSRIDEATLHIAPEDEKIVLQATACQNPEVQDVVVIERKGRLAFAWLWLQQHMEACVIRFVLRRCKKYMFLRNKYLKDI